MTLFFDLNDNDLDPLITTRAAIDNIGLAATIAELADPAPFAMMMAGLLAIVMGAGKAPHKPQLVAKSA